MATIVSFESLVFCSPKTARTFTLRKETRKFWAFSLSGCSCNWICVLLYEKYWKIQRRKAFPNSEYTTFQVERGCSRAEVKVGFVGQAAKWFRIPSMVISSVQAKTDFYAHFDIHRLPVSLGRFETPFLHRCQCFLVETVSQSVNDVNIARQPVGTDN